MMNKKQHVYLMWVIGILFVMSVMPGEGNKAADQQAIVATPYTCSTSADCPVCVGSGLQAANSTGFLGELSAASCVTGKCQLSDSCLIWDCKGTANCNSVKQTILDNTINKFNNNPMLLVLIIGLIVAFFMLG